MKHVNKCNAQQLKQYHQYRTGSFKAKHLKLMKSLS